MENRLRPSLVGNVWLKMHDIKVWVSSSNEEEPNSTSAVLHVHVRECEGIHQMQSVLVLEMYCVPVGSTVPISEVLSIVKLHLA